MIPRWVSRVVWAFRGKRYVRLLPVPTPADHPNLPTWEGVLVGCWGGHYVLLAPRALVAKGSSSTLDGILEVPRERVAAVQVVQAP